MRRSSHKKAFLSSLILLLLCFAMLLGTTFAWFTKNVSTSVSTIQSGNLKVKLQYVAQLPDGTVPNLSDESSWQDAGNTLPLFDERALWEPGYTGIVYLRVVNDGNLALKYQYRINITNNTLGTSVTSEPIDLTNYLKLAVVEKAGSTVCTEDEVNRALVSAAMLSSQSGLVEETGSGRKGVAFTDSNNVALLPEATQNTSGVIAIIVHMPTDVGNVANPQNGESVPSLTLSFDVAATQYNNESDSFGPNYDASAPDATYETVQPEGSE